MKYSLAAGGAIPGLLLCASLAWATYSVPISSFSEATGTASAGQYEIAFTVGQASPIGTAASGAFAVVSGIVPAVMDVVPPVILHSPVPLAAAGAAVTIQADIEDEVAGVDSAVLHYREGGLTAFKTRRMDQTAGTTYEAEIPASAMTERGLVYYIEATDARGNVATVPAHAPDSLQNLPVYFAALVSDLNIPSRQYRMFSLPGTPTSGDPDSILVDDYGAYDRTAWRVGRWNPADSCTTGCYDEYPDIVDFAPGRAYWLVLESSRMFDFSGISTDVSRPAPIHIEKGWNQIGTPYAFGTSWAYGWIEYAGDRYTFGTEHVVGNDTIMVENNLIAYDGAYQSFQTSLGAWVGYWVYNASTVEVDIAFPPRILSAPSFKAPIAEENIEALFGIEVSWPGPDGGTVENTCYAGLAGDARDGWDRHDLHSPPPLDGQAGAAMERRGWGRLSGRYMADIRSLSGDGKTWVITIESPEHIYAGVRVESLGELPAGWNAALYDRARGIKVTDLSQPLTVHVPGRAQVELAVGTDGFIAGEETESNLHLRTQVLSLMPNPFSEDLTVSFYLSSPQRVSVDIFNIEGARIASLADEVLGAGVHSRTWNGRTSSGHAAASGVYFMKIEAGGLQSTSKVIKLK
jgi:hypothetical protein